MRNLPFFSIFALPIGKIKSFSNTSSVIGYWLPYNSSFSKNTTGSGSRIAAFNNPLESSELYGEIT